MFDKKYYDDIWGSVHRHDYCECLAQSLIDKYGKCKILDIGTGCGYLVKLLREKGCEAWGIDISPYALQNACSPYVQFGDVRDISFKDRFFDVVHSQGLWGYFPEEDIEKAWRECNRVGRLQEHNIDYDDYIPEHQMLIKKPKEWWDARLVPRVLVTCPTYDGKEYCFQRWIDMAKSLTYPNYDIFVVDNSKTEDFYNKYKTQIPMAHLTFEGEKNDAMYRVCKSMAHVQKHFLANPYSHWMNIEADNIPPPHVIETLLKYSGGDADWVAHAYPATPGNTFIQGIGCALFSRRLMKDFPWSDTGVADDSPDSELWNWVLKRGGYKTSELWFVMEVLHLK